MVATLSTLAQTEQKFEAAAAEQQPTPQVAETPSQPVNNNGQQEEPKEQLQPEQPAAEQPIEQPQEDNVSTFDLSPVDTPQPQEDNSQPPSTPTNGHKAEYNWKEELKKLNSEEVLKEIGLSEFALEIDKHIKNGGSAADYISAKAVDWNKVTDEDLIKQEYKAQYPNLSPEDINRLFNRKYGVNKEMTEDERDDRSIELKADAYLKRQSKIAEQQKFKIAEPLQQPKDEQYEQWKEFITSRQSEIEKERNIILNHPSVKSLNESKRVAVSVGKDIQPFNFDIKNPELIVKNLTDDGSTWRKLTSTETGEPDVPKQQLLTLFAYNPQKFVQDIFNYGVSYGTRRKIVEEGQNAHKPTSPAPNMPLNEKPSYGTGKFGDRPRE